MGFHSLAAAAAGWQVEAFESGKLDLLSFQASSAYNSFTEAVRIHQVRPALQTCMLTAPKNEAGKSLKLLRGCMSSLCHVMQSRSCSIQVALHMLPSSLQPVSQ